ncbi:24708_t:CDS:2, partial [Racocetra persica]
LSLKPLQLESTFIPSYENKLPIPRSLVFTSQHSSSRDFVLLGINITDPTYVTTTSFDRLYITVRDTEFVKQRIPPELMQFNITSSIDFNNQHYLHIKSEVKKSLLRYSKKVKKIMIPSVLNIIGFTPNYYDDIHYLESRLYSCNKEYCPDVTPTQDSYNYLLYIYPEVFYIEEEKQQR